MRASDRSPEPPIRPPRAAPADHGGRPLTLAGLAHQARARMLDSGARIGCTLRLVPVHGRAGAWMVLRARGVTPTLPTLRPTVPPFTLDLALQVDLLLRWIDPPPATDQRGTGTSAAAGPGTVDRLAPLALLLERDGPVELSDIDIGWWQAVRIAAGIVGRRAVAACLACPEGVRDIRDQHDNWPASADGGRA